MAPERCDQRLCALHMIRSLDSERTVWLRYSHFQHIVADPDLLEAVNIFVANEVNRLWQSGGQDEAIRGVVQDEVCAGLKHAVGGI